MPLQGLPFVLDNILAGLLAQNVLTTWKITGGDTFVNISLQFNIEDNGSGMDNTQVTHRKTSPAQVARDSNRFTEWHAKKAEYNGAETVHCDNITSELKNMLVRKMI